MDKKFQGQVLFRKSFWVRNLQYRILLETSETHWRKTGQPAYHPERADEQLETHMELLKIQERMGVDRVVWQDHIAAVLMDNFLGRWLNKIRRKEPYENIGLLLHPNRFLQE
ncbi:MAG: hypothetical protein WAU07_00185 [Microgenomates group bacterium]